MEGVEKPALDVGEGSVENLNFNPDRRAEISWTEGEDNGAYDPDKRAEISWTVGMDNGDNAYDPDKRADVSWPEGELVAPDAPDNPMMELPSGSFCPVIDDGNPVGKLIDESQCEQVVADFPEASDFGESKTDAKGLTEEEKARLKEETGWSDETLDSISSMEEARIYQEAGLVEHSGNHENSGKLDTSSPIDFSRQDEPKEKGEPIQNKVDGLRREEEVANELKEKYPEEEGYEIISEGYLRDEEGKIVKDPVTGEARRIDFVVVKDGKVVDSIEVTSRTADKTDQMTKENRIRENGGNYVKDSKGNLVEIPRDVRTRIERRD